MKTRLGTGLGMILALSLLAVGCGDGEDSSGTGGAADNGPTLEQDTAAIEKLMVEYGASVGDTACDFYSADFIVSEFESLEGCRRKNADTEAVKFTVDDVTINGDTASAAVVVPGEGRPTTYPVVREGDAADAYDGWLINAYPKKVRTAAEAPDAPPEDSEIPAGGDPDAEEDIPLEQSTPQANALGESTAYQTCVEARGAQGVKNQPFGYGDSPLVSFEAGGSVVAAAFAPTTADATEARKEAAPGAPIVQVDSILLFTESGTAPESAIGMALDCAEEVTGA